LTFALDCKTVVLFADRSNAGQHTNKRSGAEMVREAEEIAT